MAPTPKVPSSCDWVASDATEEMLESYVAAGSLASKDVLKWRVPGEEVHPEPKEGEVIVFTSHLERGFSPPGSKFFQDILDFYHISPQDIGPNSVTNLCQFQVFCEAYLQVEPPVSLFREYFYLNRQTEAVDGPLFECGGVTIQRRRGSI